MAADAEESALRFVQARRSVVIFQAPTPTSLKPIGTTTYIDWKNRQQNRSWSVKAPTEWFQLVGYHQSEKDETENQKQNWMHDAILALFQMALDGRTVRFEGKDLKIALKDNRVRVSDYKEPNKQRRITGKPDCVFYDTDRKRYYFFDLKTVQSLRERNLPNAVLKIRVAQQLRVYALLLKWAKNLDYLPDAYVLGLHLEDRGKAGYWLLQNPKEYNTIEEAINV